MSELKEYFPAWSTTDCGQCGTEFQVTRTESREIAIRDCICGTCEAYNHGVNDAKQDPRLSDDPSISLAAVMREFDVEFDLSACGSGLFEPSITISSEAKCIYSFDSFATITADDIHRESE